MVIFIKKKIGKIGSHNLDNNTFLINPNFLCRNLTGIERFAFETCKRLDLLLQADDDIRIIIPSNAKTIPQYKNIKTIKINKPLKSFPLWDLFQFASYCRKYKATGINFSNTAPLGPSCGLSFIHDIYAKQYPQDFISHKEKLVRLYSCFNYKNIAHNAKKVLTVSDFSREQIKKLYKVSAARIEVIPNGWDHFKDVEYEAITDSEAFLTPGNFYFTLGSLQKRKNLGWIAKYAATHPEQNFAISGKAVSGFVSGDIAALQSLPNVKLLGYVTDSQVKWLMKNCKAFIFPSYYEGFGIPPLEALSVGAKIIVGNAASLPEIYKDSAVYIDPYNTDCNLEELISNYPSNCNQSAALVLNEYTYDKAAQKLYNILKQQN